MAIPLHLAVRTALAACGAFACSAALATVVTLPRYNVSFNDVSVSGISSGGYMAAQMHFAYSKTVRKGAGVIAGGPVYCSQGNVYIATGPCMADTGSRDLSYLISVVNTWSGNGYIDPTSNLSASKVYLFSGTIDSTVRQPVMNDLKTMYANYVPAANITYKNNIAAEHSLPTDYYGNACSFNGNPYINNCNFDASGEILKWIYGPLNAKNAGTLGGSFVNFDQTAFWGNFDPTNHGMSNDGWAYVPANCAAGQACKLHVVFHGCKQNVATVGSAFYRNTGYNKWADTNNIIVLYPQANVTSANPNGCWDWWGYDDVNFPAKSGGQMVAVKTMIDRVVSGNASSPYTCAHWFASNYEHVYYGRAYASGGNAYATNSNQYLGYYSTAAYTDVRRTSSGYYAYGSCP
ncbi:extracellular catalytic domain type 2 short-chain-length polyhydroxyalkanoate depolymerase [Noviherbaspirillum galbum]|uniref:PHA-depolymerase-like protein n=1 Tax=Noviherbaspirillum galbum TaxID=2709383 RepID=A0A6B3SSZ3_9BURK|nr:PHB depolymerase family esterase [Noviherbaspirillum galbum]NEX60739.1 PHA-depolymerase-like protein [Noviherbaspirillum galbum]